MTAVNVTPRINISAETVEAARRVDQERGMHLRLCSADGQEMALPAPVEEVLLKTLEAIAKDGGVVVGRVPEELTSTQAADLLGVSRPTLLRWAHDGLVPSFRAGTHARFKRTDVMRLRAERENERRAAFDALRALDAEDDFAHVEF